MFEHKNIEISIRTTGTKVGYDELLELLIIDYDTDETIFHELFRPKKRRQWEGPIKPIDVWDCESFSKYREVIQSIIDEAEDILGFDVSREIDFLKFEGIKFPSIKYSYADRGFIKRRNHETK